MYKVIIIDDEPLAATIVQEYLSNYADFEVVQTCQNGFEGLKAIQRIQPDLIFLDVQMPKLNGFELLELLDEQHSVIFTTAFDAYAMKAFDAHAVDYLLKPFSEDRFAQAIKKFKSTQESSNLSEMLKDEVLTHSESAHRVVVKVRNEIKIIPIKDVKYIQANDDYVDIHTGEGKFLKNKTLTHFEKVLPNDVFVRVHRSYIVSVDQITKIDPYEKDSYVVILKTGEKIPVSKTGLPKLKAILGI